MSAFPNKCVICGCRTKGAEFCAKAECLRDLCSAEDWRSRRGAAPAGWVLIEFDCWRCKRSFSFVMPSGDLKTRDKRAQERIMQHFEDHDLVKS